MKKITKKDRKRMSTPNAMVNRSFRDGKKIKIGGVVYHGVQRESEIFGNVKLLPLVRVW